MMYNKLTDKDKKAIEAYIKKHNGSGKIATTLENLLRFWDSNKSLYLSQLFGDELIISKKITFTKSPNEIMLEMKKDASFYNFRDKIINLVENDDTIPSRIRWYMYDALSYNALAENKVQKYLDFTYSLKNGKTFKVSPNMKVMKVFEKMVENYGIDKEEFEKFRIRHSQFLNQKTIKGELCISIHPLDYMTMSDNTNGWASCMSWRNNGCYRRGTVGMMNSPTVIVAYLKAEEDMVLVDDYKWNSKKWRCLFVASNTFITSVKGYPYDNPELNTIVIEWLKELSVKVDPNSRWSENHFYGGTFNEIVEGKDINFDIYVDNDYYAMYNDFDTVDSIVSFNLDREEWNLGVRVEHDYSGPEVCMTCGEYVTKESFDYATDTEGYLSCLDCLEMGYCSCCEGHYPEDELIEFKGEKICQGCFEDYTRKCFATDQWEWSNTMEKFFIRTKEDDMLVIAYMKSNIFFNEDLNSVVFKAKPERKNIGKLWARYEYVINEDDLTDLGRERLKKLIF